MKNPAVSIRARLLNLARQTKVPFQDLLEHFAMGRFLWRLSRSGEPERYILKGAQLFHLWGAASHRPTRDLDLLGTGPPDEETLRVNFEKMLAGTCEPDDGLIWGKVSTGPIRQDLAYGGVRATLPVSLDGARITLQIDVGFGDAVSPRPLPAQWEGLLGFPAATLLVYPPETVIAEKLEAAVILDIRNTRMKDFFDLDWLCRHMEFNQTTLRAAILATFERRGTKLPAADPLALTAAFSGEISKVAQWKSFLSRNRLSADPLPEVIERLRDFLDPVLFPAPGDSALKWVPVRGWQRPP